MSPALYTDVGNDPKHLNVNTSQLQGDQGVLIDLRVANIGRRDTLQPMFAPHQKMPPELLARIFTHCVNNDTIQVRSRSQDPLPWILGHVCSRWRQIALAEPLLWHRIDARGYSPLPPSTIKFIREILAHRGGNAAIELQITPGCDEDWTELLDLCSTYPSRVRSLRITIDAWYSPAHLRHPIRAFNHFESVVLNFCRPSYASVISDIDGANAITAFTTARCLRKVEVHREGSHNPNLIDVISFPWAQLTSLTISSISTVAISRILCECVELKDLVVGLQVNGSGPHYVLPTVIRLTHLRSITIQFGVDSAAFLGRLITPSLKNLTFGRWALASPRCILDLIERSNCDLEMLHCPADETPDIISLLKAMPYLQALIIPSIDPIPQESLDAIRIMNLSPKLRTLTIPISSIHSVVRFLKSRWSKSPGGEYEGVRDAKIRIAEEDFALEKEWYEALAPKLMRNGLTVGVVLT